MIHFLSVHLRKGRTVAFLLALLLFINLAIIGVWDVVAIYYDRHDLTVSSVIYEWSQSAPTVLLWAGIVIGHCFLPLKINSK